MKTIIELDDTNNTVQLIKDVNGIKREKTIMLEDFVESLNLSLERDKKKDKEFKPIFSPIFVERDTMRLIQTIQIGVRSFMYILFRGKTFSPMPVCNRYYDNVGVPNLIFGIKVVNNRFSSLYVVATKEDCITEETEVFTYPFSNVFNNTKVCLGGNKIEIEFSDVKSIFAIPNYFFSMPNTLSDFKNSNNSQGMGFDELLVYLTDKTFDNSLLVQLDKKDKSYKCWVESIT